MTTVSKSRGKIWVAFRFLSSSPRGKRKLSYESDRLSFVVLLIFNEDTLIQMLIILCDDHHFTETSFNNVFWLLR